MKRLVTSTEDEYTDAPQHLETSSRLTQSWSSKANHSFSFQHTDLILMSNWVMDFRSNIQTRKCYVKICGSNTVYPPFNVSAAIFSCCKMCTVWSCWDYVIIYCFSVYNVSAQFHLEVISELDFQHGAVSSLGNILYSLCFLLYVCNSSW